MKRSNQKSHTRSRLSIVVAIAMIGLFGLSTGSALADANETSASSSNSYIQSSISAGGNSTCVLFNGAAKCWGANNKGQLGNGSTVQSFSPVSVAGLSSGVTAISVGNNHACAVVSGGVKCWGANESGQLGNNSTTDSLTPVSVSGLSSGVTAVSVGGSTYSYNNRSSNYSCAVVSGAVKCWGSNGSGQLGNSSTIDSLTPVPVSGLTSGVTSISVGGSSSYSSDSVHACAVVSGAAKCWGSNGSGQLGNSSTTDSSIPVPVSGLTTGVTAISVGGGAGMMGGNSNFTCAVVSGAAKCWGANSSGQLGNGVSGYSAGSNVPVAVSNADSGISAISTGDTHACAVDSGAVKCWGSNGSGQLGNGLKSYSATNTLVSVSGVSSGVTALSLGYSHSCAVTTTALKCWGSNSYGQSGPSAFAVTQVTGLTSGVTGLSSAINGNASHVCAIQSGGLKCWGHNMFGQLGNGTKVDANTPQQVVGLTAGVTSVDGLTCAAVSGAVKCWGNGGGGNQPTTPVDKFSFSNATAVAGLLAVCVIDDGAVKCWGDGWNGELGIGAGTYAATPQQAVGIASGATAISAGMRSHVCAVVAGTAMCWGSGEYGKLGIGSTTDARTPQQVTGLSAGVTAISAGSGHTCAVISGAAKCWGSNSSGELGDGSSTNSNTPVQVTGLTSGVTAIAAGEGNSCAVVNGAVKCWGSNGSGLLGSGLNESSNTPVNVSGMSSGATAVTLSRAIACAIKTGAVKCWGDNSYGALGNGTTGANDYFNFTTAQEVDGIGPLTTTSTSSTTSTTVAVAGGQTGASTTSSTVAKGQASVATIPKSNASTTTTLAVAGGMPVSTTSTTIPVPNAPQVGPGEAAALVDGQSVSVSVSRNENRVTTRVAGIEATISGLTPESQVVSLDSDGNLRLDTEDQIVVDASGYVAGQEVAVWMYSTPSRLGMVTADASGNISGVFDLPAGIDSGDHRVVLDGANENGQPVIISLGIAVGSVDSSSMVSRLLIIIPVLLAIFAGLFIPAAVRRRRREEAA